MIFLVFYPNNKEFGANELLTFDSKFVPLSKEKHKKFRHFLLSSREFFSSKVLKCHIRVHFRVIGRRGCGRQRRGTFNRAGNKCLFSINL